MTFLSRLFGRKPEDKRDPPTGDPLMAHAVSFVSGPNFNPRKIVPGSICRHVSWDGCMATVRKEGPEGVITRVGVKSRYCGDMLGMIVRFPDGTRFPSGEMWVPFQDLKKVNGKIEWWA